MYSSFGENIKRCRKKIGMTQEELAYKVGYKSRQAVSMIETGKTDLPVGMAKAIANALGVPVEELMVLSPEEQRENETFEYLPYLLKAEDWKLDAIRKILDMPPRKEDVK